MTGPRPLQPEHTGLGSRRPLTACSLSSIRRPLIRNYAHIMSITQGESRNREQQSCPPVVPAQLGSELARCASGRYGENRDGGGKESRDSGKGQATRLDLRHRRETPPQTEVPSPLYNV